MGKFSDALGTLRDTFTIGRKAKIDASALTTERIYDLPDKSGELLTDAPSNGKQYARKDAAWAEVSSGGGGGNPGVVTGDPEQGTTVNLPAGTIAYIYTGETYKNFSIRLPPNPTPGQMFYMTPQTEGCNGLILTIEPTTIVGNHNYGMEYGIGDLILSYHSENDCWYRFA